MKTITANIHIGGGKTAQKGGRKMKKQNIAWIQEKTKEEVEAVRDKLLQSKKIKSAGEIEKYIYCRNRKTGEPIYHYQCECEEA